MLIDDSFGDDNISQDQSGIILISGKPRYQLGEFAYWLGESSLAMAGQRLDVLFPLVEEFDGLSRHTH